MILPTNFEPIAKLAYQRFVKTAAPEPPWERLAESVRSLWRDRVFAADKMRRYASLEDWADDCALQAIRKFEGESVEPAVKKAAPAEPASESIPTKKKKEK